MLIAAASIAEGACDELLFLRLTRPKALKEPPDKL
jgi:hypothetical protein